MALSKALSAAADLLSAGDFTIATPGTTLLYHGTSVPNLESRNAKWATLTAYGMSSSNQKYAVSLGRKAVPRSAFIYSAFRPTLGEVRREINKPSLSDLESFQAILHQRLSPAGQRVLDLANARCGPYFGVLNCLHARIKRIRSSKRRDIQKAILNASVAFEFSTHGKRPGWSLDGGALERISRCYFFFEEFLGNGDKPNEVLGLNHGSPYFHLLPFCLAVCGALQEGENLLTATDALWLGLVDTVRADIPAMSTS